MSTTQKLTLEQAVIITAYTGYTFCPIDKMIKAVEKKFGRKLVDRELPHLREEIKEAFKEEARSLYWEEEGANHE